MAIDSRQQAMVTEYTIYPVARAGGLTSLDQALNFQARSVIVDNSTNQFLLIDGRWRVNPYTVGYVASLNGTTQARASFIAPDGFAAAPKIATESATLQYVDVALPPSPATSVQPPVRSTQLAQSISLVNGSVGANINIPSGTNTLWIFVPNTTAVSMSVTGNTTNATYLGSTVFDSGAVVAVTVLGDLDASVHIVVTATAVATMTLATSTQVFVESVIGVGQAPVTVVPGKPPDLLNVEFDVSLGAGTSSVILAAPPAGQRTLLYAWGWSWSPTSANVGNYVVQLQDTGGGTIDAIPANYATVAGLLASPRSHGPQGGVPLDILTLGVQIKNVTAVVGGSVEVGGYLLYAQR